METVIEIRHYLSRAGKDVFDDWLTGLADARTQAKIAARINRLAAGNFGDCKSLGQGLYELRIDWGPGYRVYYAMVGKFACCFYAEAINGNSLRTLNGRWHTSKIIGKGPEPNETESQRVP
jgi:putative addiction module killer protein